MRLSLFWTVRVSRTITVFCRDVVLSNMTIYTIKREKRRFSHGPREVNDMGNRQRLDVGIHLGTMLSR